jgi:hypothetical protein
MGERRFEDLREALLQAGVAGQPLRRALLEIETHFQHLVDEERSRGTDYQDAHIAAHGLLGTNETLVLSYAARPELHAWSRRWPAVWFVILPLITYTVISGATLAGIFMVADRMAPYLHTIHLAPQTTHDIDLAAHIALLWVFPASVFLTFAVLAYRRRVALRWPLGGIVLTSLLVSLINVSLKFTGGPAPGELGAGIGLSLESLPGQILRAAILASLAVVPLWAWARHGAEGAGLPW